LKINIQTATNTRGDIKSGIKDLGACIREFTKVANVLGMTRTPDAVEKCLKQQQLQQQNSLDMLKKIQAAQRQGRPLDPLRSEDKSPLIADIAKGFHDLRLRMDTYEKKGDELLERTAPEIVNTNLSEWTEVVKKSKNQKKQSVPEAVSTTNKVDIRKRTNKRNPAILVDSKPENFPTLAERLSKDVKQ
jgi:hypothetical protein